MSASSLPSISMEDVTEFHDQLRRLQGAGLEFDLGYRNPQSPETADLPTDKQLDLLIGLFARELSLGKSIHQTLAVSPLVPRQYRLALQSWCYGNRSVVALDVLHQPARKRRSVATDVSLALLHPLILLGLCFAAWLYLTLVVTPRIASIYEQLNEAPSWQTRWLLVLRDWVPWWSSIVPVVVVLAVIVWRRRLHTWQFAWLPGRRRALARSEAEQVALGIATITDNQDESGSQSDVLNAASADLAGAEQGNRKLPMLRWAMSKLQKESRGASAAMQAQPLPLKVAAALYRLIDDDQNQRRKQWLPVAIGFVLGGSLVLMYCLALVTPIVALLFDVIRTSR